MKKIYKHGLSVGRNRFEMPLGAEIVFVDAQNQVPTIWFEFDQDTKDVEIRYFTIFGTGHDIPADAKYVGSCQIGPFVWHIYEG